MTDFRNHSAMTRIEPAEGTPLGLYWDGLKLMVIGEGVGYGVELTLPEAYALAGHLLREIIAETRERDPLANIETVGNA